MRAPGHHKDKRPAVLHLGLDPQMGVWSALRVLAAGQRASGLYSSVGIAVLADVRWPRIYEQELAATRSPCFRKRLPRTFGTAQALSQCLRTSYLEKWLNELLLTADAGHVILHSHAGWLSGVLLPLRSSAPRDISIITTFHGVNPALKAQPVRRRLHAWMARRLRRSPARLTSVDHSNLATYESILGIPCSEFSVIPNGVPDTDLRGCPFLQGHTPFTIGYVGRIFADKGWRTAADAVLGLAESGEKVRLLLVGCGPDEDEARALANRYPDVIHFLGRVPNARDAVMPKMDLLTLMSDYEAFPMTIIEAMSLGIPSAATNVGDIARQIDDGNTGFILPADPARLGAAIRELAHTPGKLADFGKRARQRFADRYTIEHIVREYHRLYTLECLTSERP